MVYKGGFRTTAEKRRQFVGKYLREKRAVARYTRPGELGRTQYGRARGEGMHIDRAELLKHLTDAKKYFRGSAAMKRHRQMLIDAKRPYRRAGIFGGLGSGTAKPKPQRPKRGGIRPF